MYSSYQQAPTGGGVAAGATLTSGTPSAVMQSEGGSPPPAPQGIVIRGYINITAGATAGGYALKMFRGAGIGGTQVGITDTVQTIVSVAQTFYFSFVDTAPTGGGVYTLSVTAAGSNGTFNDGAIEVFVPTGGTDV